MTETELQEMPWFIELVAEVNQELKERQLTKHDQAPSLEHEKSA